MRIFFAISPLPLLLICLYFLPAITGQSASYAAEKQFSSGPGKVTLVELYTSEGCSSCPPAEKWLGSLKEDPGLWQRFVPVAFHVDYWDYIGWKDPFADSRYGKRQQQYRQLGNIQTVYTPGMLLDGKEWRKWHYKKSVPANGDTAGKLQVSLNGNILNADFTVADPEQRKDWQLNIAVLGFNLESNVRSGENAGRRLQQEFVVLDYVRKNSSNGQWQITLPQLKKNHSRQTGIAVWVNKAGEQIPVQATGGWL